jgi:CheY-like chemotaxis protein
MPDPEISERTLLAHELRSPLGAILAYTDLLIEDESASPERAERLLVVRNHVQWLVRLTASMLSHAGAHEPESGQACDPVVATTEIIALCAPTARNLGLLLSLDDRTHGARLSLLSGKHELHFRQMLSNLLGNALKFTHDGGIRVGLELAAGSAGDDRLVVTVQDTGVGMDAAQLAMVGQPFLQVHVDSKRRGGLGLGLNTVKGLARQLGGELAIDSAVGRGSTCTFSVPVQIQPGTAPTTAGPSASLVGSYVLVADDDSAARLQAAVLLKRAGARVTLANDGSEALTHVRTANDLGRPFRALVLDLHMPASGGGLVTSLRSAGCAARIIGCSSAPSARQPCLDAGMDAFLDKPLNDRDLRQAVLESSST